MKAPAASPRCRIRSAAASCATITYLDESPPITDAAEISPDQAYFYGEFYEVSSQRRPYFVIFEETETAKQLLIPFHAVPGCASMRD